MATVRYQERMVKGGLCGIGGGGLGLCNQHMGAGQLCRTGVRQPRQVGRFSVFFHRTYGAIGAHKSRWGVAVTRSEDVYASAVALSLLLRVETVTARAYTSSETV